MGFSDRAWKRETRRLPKWKELLLAKKENKETILRFLDEKNKKVVK